MVLMAITRLNNPLAKPMHSLRMGLEQSMPTQVELVLKPIQLMVWSPSMTPIPSSMVATKQML